MRGNSQCHTLPRALSFLFCAQGRETSSGLFLLDLKYGVNEDVLLLNAPLGVSIPLGVGGIVDMAESAAFSSFIDPYELMEKFL